MDVARLHQAGVTYAVATLGTATTPEHLRRIFKLVNEVVFCFDGDKAGRAAAWRALGNALPEAREGRQIRFLFLPEGHDPDSLVGEEGREAFEKRLDGALPLSEYLATALAEQADLTHADGRAQFAELARPLVTKVAPGVYRDLLIDRLIGVDQASSRQIEPIMVQRGHRLGRQPCDVGSLRAGGCALQRQPVAARARWRRRQGPGDQGRETAGAFPGHRGPGLGSAAHAAGDDRRRRLALPVRAHRPAAAGSGREYRGAADALAGAARVGPHDGAGRRRSCWASTSPARRSSWLGHRLRLGMEPTLRRHQELIDKGELTDDERAELRELTVAMARSKSDCAEPRGAARPAAKYFARRDPFGPNFALF